MRSSCEWPTRNIASRSIESEIAALTRWCPAEDSRRAPQPYDAKEDEFRLHLESGINLQGIPLEDFLTDKEFQLTRVQYTPDPGSPDRRVRIECEDLGSEGCRRRAGANYWLNWTRSNPGRSCRAA